MNWKKKNKRAGERERESAHKTTNEKKEHNAPTAVVKVTHWKGNENLCTHCSVNFIALFN